MKITDPSPQTVIRQADDTPQARHSEAARKKKAPKAGTQGDTVSLSAAVDSELDARQAEQAEKVRAIKELIKEGKYQVEPRAVAAKMIAGSKTPPDQPPSAK